MKYCKNCGAENNEGNKFCFNCRCESFSDVKSAEGIQPVPPIPPVPPVAGAYPNQAMQGAPRPFNAPPPPPQFVPMPPRLKKPLGIFELLTILGFVCSIVGMFSISMILHPIGAVASIIGFVNGKRFRAIALAGTIISIVGGIIYTVFSLYHNGMLPEWITYGAWH